MQMIKHLGKKVNFVRNEGLSGFESPGFVDIHCHCLPDLDDGPANINEARDLCEALVADGVTTAIATPHQLGCFNNCHRASDIRRHVTDLNTELKKHKIPLTVLPGADIRVDERIPKLLEFDRILTLADEGKYILLELPHNTFIDIEPLLKELLYLGITPVISHPERHETLHKRPKTILKWLETGANFQVTASSLIGFFGPAAKRAGWRFLCSGWANLVATDAHGKNHRRPMMKAAFKRISNRLGVNIARLVCVENPSRVASDKDAVPVCLHSLHDAK